MTQARDNSGASRWVIINIVLWSLVLVLFGGWLIYATQFDEEQLRKLRDIVGQKLPAPAAPSFECPLDGTRLTLSNRSAANRRPVMVQIDNAPAARPQSGMSQADIVYESQVEGDLTRFSAIYACHEADVVGPVRSARLINLELVPQYNALLANSGSSDGVTEQIEARTDIPNIVHSNYPQAYDRVFDRAAPHNLMTSTATIREAAAGGGHEAEVSIAALTFKDDAPAPQISSVRVRYSAYADVNYRYDAATNGWLRFLQGDPHIDSLNGNQILVRNVIIQYVETTESEILEDVGGNFGLDFNLSGSGRVQIFRDGTMVEGTWKREGRFTMTTYLDGAGQPIPLNRGLTFIQVVPPGFEPGIS